MKKEKISKELLEKQEQQFNFVKDFLFRAISRTYNRLEKKNRPLKIYKEMHDMCFCFYDLDKKKFSTSLLFKASEFLKFLKAQKKRALIHIDRHDYISVDIKLLCDIMQAEHNIDASLIKDFLKPLIGRTYKGYTNLDKSAFRYDYTKKDHRLVSVNWDNIY